MKRMIMAAWLFPGMLPLMAYVPEPQPVKSAVEITALYYPGTEHMPEWDMIAQTRPEIKPLLGWYDESNPEVIDWQIKWAVEHGISNFCVDWYWNKGRRRLEHWVTGYYKARYRKYLKWYMMYANHNQRGAHSSEDQIAVTRYWIDHYFKTPEYYTIDGKPVVCYWDAKGLDRDFIAEAAAKGEVLKAGEGLRRAFALSEKLVKAAGLPGIHWQLMWTSPEADSDDARARRRSGFASSISYGCLETARLVAPKADDLTFDNVIEGFQKIWETRAVQRELPWWLPIPTGWDDRPRTFSKANVIRNRTPEKFAGLCRAARAFCEKHQLTRVVIHPLNEWQEGSYIEPNEEYGFAMYEAIREAFCEKPAAGWPKNLRPADVGLGPYDYPPLFRSSVQRWDFSRSTEGWYRQPFGAAELYLDAGCLNFWTTWWGYPGNFNIRQRVVPFAASAYRTFRLRMKLTPNASVDPERTKSLKMFLKWGTPACPVIGPGLVVDRKRCCQGCPVTADGAFHDYTLDLSANADWTGMVDELWFEACLPKNIHVAIDWMTFE